MAWLLPQLAPTFEAALRDVEAARAEARIAAAEQLGRPGAGREAEARAALERLARDAVPAVRRAAVRALGELGGSARTLAERVADPDARVREVAVIGLASAGTDAHDALRRALTSEHAEVRFQAALSYAEIAPDAATAILPLLDDGDPEVRANAARALGTCQSAESVAALRLTLDDRSTRVRHEAALALARRGAAPPTDALSDALTDAELVLEALDALGTPEHRAAADRIASLTDALLRPLVVKALAARALVRMGDARGVAALRRMLAAWRSDGRHHALQTIAELGLVELVPELARLAVRPRGVDPEALVTALAAFAGESDTARAGLRTLARRADSVGALAREALGPDRSA